ncbi:hypothetical protein ACEWY4_017776 [Coilia grayii]|uniref:B-cell receptor CD22 n=1 Tax=Coilia grayii TaxID=363190 RepID=A0ABD1JHU4_9TELE
MEDLSKKGEYANRVKYLGKKDSDCALRIEDLRESDSGEYRFRFLTNPGALQVEMSPTAVTEGQSVTLTCRPTCDTGAEPTFVWYKNSEPVANQPPTTMTINTVKNTDSGSYSCAVKGHENHPSPAVALNVHYSPKNTSASFSPPGDIVEGDSVTLTCSSDANPPVHTYTWYKNRGVTTVGSGQNHIINNINCPRNTSASISPPGNIVEGDSVTLTCSSDANPPVHNYTWYKVNSSETTLGSGQNHSISNISSGDTGQYYCRVENSVGYSDSVVLYVNVFYSPKKTLCSKFSDGHSATLTCDSDANPPVHTYTWYKKTGADSMMGSCLYLCVNPKQADSSPIYDDIATVPMTSDLKQRMVSGDEDDVQYASVQFKAKNKDKAPDSTAPQPHVQEKGEDVEYASVNICRPSSAVNQSEDDSVIYSTVKKRQN